MSDETNIPQDPGQTPEPQIPEQQPTDTTAPIPQTPPPPPPPVPPVETTMAQPAGQGAATPGGPGLPVEPPKVRKKRVGFLAGLLIALVLIAAGAAAAVMLALRGTGDVLLKKAPDNSLAFATAYLDPSAGQKMNIESLLRKFPSIGQTDLGKQFDGFMNTALAGTGLNFETDVKPWLGTQVGLVVVPDGNQPGVAALLASKDDSAAQTALAKMKSGDTFSSVKWKDQDYKGVTITTGSYDYSSIGIDMGTVSPAMVYAIVDGTVVLSSDENTVKAIVDTSKGDTKSLADSTTYTDTMAQLPKERVAEVFVNGAAITDLLKQSADLTSLPTTTADAMKSIEAMRGAGVSISVGSDGVTMKMASLLDTSKLPAGSTGAAPHENAVVSWTPADAYGFVAGGDLPKTLNGLVAQLDQASPGTADQLGLGKAIDALSGDFGVVVTPGSAQVPAGAVLMATNNEAAMKDFMDQIATIASSLASGSSSSGAMTPTMPGTLPLANTTPAPEWLTEDYQGVTISYLPLPAGANAPPGVSPAYAVTDGMAIIATSPDEIKKLIDAHGGMNITSSANYKAAIANADAQNSGIFYMDLEATIRAVAPGLGDTSAINDLKPLKALVITSSGTREKPTATIFILIK